MKLLSFLPLISSSLALLPPHYTRHTQHYPYNPWPYIPTGTGTGTGTAGCGRMITVTATTTVTITALPTAFLNTTTNALVAEASGVVAGKGEEEEPVTLITLPSVTGVVPTMTATLTASVSVNRDPSTTAAPVVGNDDKEEGEGVNLRPNDIPPATLIALGDVVSVEARGC